MHHVAGAHRFGSRRRLDNQTTGVVDGRRPPRDLPGRQRDPHLLPERGAAPPHLLGERPPAVRSLEQGAARAEGLEETVEELPAVHRLRRTARLVQAGAARFRRTGPGHVDPDAHDHRSQGGSGELRLGQHPGQLGAVEQQVVGPFQSRIDTGDGPAGVGSGQRNRPCTQVDVGRPAVGPQQYRGQQVRAGGRLPAAVETAPSGGLVVGHHDESGGVPVANPVTQVGVRRIDLVQPADVPHTAPHGKHHRVRAIVKVHITEERPA